MRRAGPLALLLACAIAPAARAEEGRTELVREVVRGERIEIRNYDGEVQVSAWDKDRVRVEADGPKGEPIVFERRGASWIVVPATWERDSGAFAIQPPGVARVRVDGPAPPRVRLRVSIPAWMPLVVESPRGTIFVEGVLGPVEATVMQGDVRVRGGRASVRLRSMAGRLELAEADGRLTLESGTGAITVRDSAGDVRVETTRGDIHLQGLRAEEVEATSVDGDVELDGALTPAARYTLTTHSGDVRVAIAGAIDATFSARSYRGRFVCEIPLQTPLDPRGGEFTLGGGSARLQLESFDGVVLLSAAGDR